MNDSRDSSSSNPRYNAIGVTYGKDFADYLHQSRVLVVGSGGIGCELLKNLAFYCFQEIVLIDLDTIDVSNLNRQFLFRPHHVGQPKSLIATQQIKQFNPLLNIRPYHANIKDSCFDIQFYKGFHIVFNALDNIDARRHVNRLCLAANVPLIDSGTTGFLGQVMPIMKGITACYECKPKPTQKVYPICTIRSTPDKPVHCIVWGKELLKLLFGRSSDSMLFEDTNATQETSTFMKSIHYFESKETETILSNISNLMNALFHDEILKRIDMGTYKTATIVPQPISLEVISQMINKFSKSLTSSMKVSEKSNWDHTLWSMEEALYELVSLLYSIAMNHSNDIGNIEFDKDDLFTMKFVFISSLLRQHIFSIPFVTFHDAKGIAGNIIPAISTTNAIVAGIQILQGIKILYAKCYHQDIIYLRHTYCIRQPQTKRNNYLLPIVCDDPEDNCYVCKSNTLSLLIDTNIFLLKDFISNILKIKLGFMKPTIGLGSSIIYEEDELLDEDEVLMYQTNLLKTLKDCPAGGIVNGIVINISDNFQDMQVKIIIEHHEVDVIKALLVTSKYINLYPISTSI